MPPIAPYWRQALVSSTNLYVYLLGYIFKQNYKEKTTETSLLPF